LARGKLIETEIHTVENHRNQVIVSPRTRRRMHAPSSLRRV